LIHEEEFAAQSFGAHLSQNTPRLVRGLVHGLTESIPLSLGIDRTNASGSRCGNSRELIVLLLRLLNGILVRPELTIFVVITLIGLNINRLNFTEVAIGVISQSVPVSQNVLHGRSTLTELLNNSLLLNQSVLKRGGILIQNARSFNAEVVNDGGGFRAELRCCRRTLIRSRGCIGAVVRGLRSLGHRILRRLGL
jgi:hypothetical protein